MTSSSFPSPSRNLRGSKRRPALVIAPLQPYEDVILCMITSQMTKDDRAIAISKRHFIAGGLPQDSHIRPNRLFTADARLIVRHAGRLSPETMDQVVAAIVAIVSG